MCKEYNGWTNWETWITKLWLDNDEYTYACILEMIEKAKADGEDLDSDALEEFVWETMDPDAERQSRAGLFQDFISSSMRMVDWQAIADAYSKDGY